MAITKKGPTPVGEMTDAELRKGIDLAYLSLVKFLLSWVGLSRGSSLPPERCLDIVREGLRRGIRPHRRECGYLVDELVDTRTSPSPSNDDA